MSMKSMIKLINSIYKKKLLQGKDSLTLRSQPLAEYVYDYLSN